MFKVVAVMATGEEKVVAEGITDYQEAWEIGKAFMAKEGLKVKSIEPRKDDGKHDESK